MSDLVEGIKALKDLPLPEALVLICFAFVGWMVYRKGEKDRRMLGPSAIEVPLFLLSGPLADAMESVHHVSEQSRVTNELLREIHREIRKQNDLMEWIGNQAGVNPPRPRR